MTIERYEVRVTPLQGVVKVEAVLFEPSSSPDLPPLASQFILKGFGGSHPWVEYVWPPNWWERWRGVTWENKVEWAKAKVECWAREQLALSLAAAATHGERGGGAKCQMPRKS